MIYKEEHRDLFTVPNYYMYVHCISSDFKMGAGIATEFAKRHVKDKLLAEYEPNKFDGTGYCLVTKMKNHTVANLVTKQYYYEKPTYETLKQSLCDLFNYMVLHDYYKIAMPKIGTGLDKLEWNKVKEIIEDVFSISNFEILVCIKE